MGRRKNQPTLNYDILVHMMSFLSHQELFSLMRTCWALYDAGIPLHVRRDTASMSQETLSSFLHFLLANPSRVRHLKSLSLGGRGGSSRCGRVLSLATRLTSLELRDAETLFTRKWGKSLGSAISLLPNLTQLVMKEIGPKGRDILRAIRSPVSSLTVAFQDPDSNEHVQALDPVDFIDFIANFSTTLAVLDTENAGFQRTDIQFPGVHTLQHSFLYYEPDLTALWHCFPNLRNLSLIDGDLYSGVSEFVEEGRARNLSRRQGMWTSLDTLECEISWAYALCLTIPHYVQTWNIPFKGYYTYRDDERFRALLRDIRPIRIRMGICFKFDVDDVDDILGGLFPEVQPTITHLSVTVYIDNVAPDFAFVAVTDVHLLWVSRLKLTFLQVRIKYTHRDSRHSYHRAGAFEEPEFPIYSITGTDIKTWDVEAHVHQLAEVSPTLQHVFFDYQLPENQHPPSYWQIIREESDIRLRSLTKEEAEMVTKSANFDIRML